jgi:uncharacterized membrane protein
MRGRGNIAVLGLPTLIATLFIYGFALKYLSLERHQYGIYWSRHEWLYAHVIAGIVALLLGPVQFWLGLNRRTTIVHRTMGALYVLAVGVGATTAFYLASHNDYGWLFGLGLGSMAGAWIFTTALAVISICLHRVEQHREWMIRSYVVTSGFITFRILYEVFDTLQVGNNMVDRMTAASWLAWAGTLLLAESILQGWKTFPGRARKVELKEDTYSVVPEAATSEFSSQRRSV